MSENIFKGVLAAALAALGAYFRQLIGPVAVLILVMMLDYVSGVADAWMHRELDSRVGLIGIVKKVFYLVIAAVGMVVDYVISLAGDRLGANLHGYYFVALMVVIWLIINECISILENAASMELPLPPFLGTLLKRLKDKAEAEEPEQ